MLPQRVDSLTLTPAGAKVGSLFSMEGRCGEPEIYFSAQIQSRLLHHHSLQQPVLTSWRRSRRKVILPTTRARLHADSIQQANPATRRTTSPARRRFVNFRSRYPTSDGYAFSKVEFGRAEQRNSASDCMQAYTRASPGRRKERRNRRHPVLLSTTPRTSNTSYMNRYSTNSETRRPLRRKSARRLGAMRSATHRASSAISLLA